LDEPREEKKGPAPAEEHRLHPAAMLVEALGAVRRYIGLSAFPGIAALVNGEFGMQTLLLVASLAVLLVILSAVWGVLQWRATRYRVEGGAFHLKRGVLARSERSLPLERVGGVNTVQGVLQRLLGVVEVRLETAGGGAGEPEISLPALSRREAGRLREELTRARRSRTGEPVEEGVEEAGPVLLRRLTARDLVVAGLTSGQIGVAAPIVLGASQTVDDLLPGDLFERLFISFVGETPALAPILLLVFGVLLFAWLLSIAGTVLAHAGFTLSRSADGKYLHIRRGLLSRYETTVPVARIQAVRLVEGTLRQPFGLAALRVESAGFAEEGGVSTMLFPLLPRREVPKFLREAAPLFDAPLDDLEPIPARARGRYALRAALPALVVAAPAAVFLFPWGLLAFLIALPLALYGLLLHRSAGFGLDRDRLVVRFRRLARTTVVAPRRRLQSRGYSVSPFQRRRRLATFDFRVASGSGGSGFQLADVDAGDARELVGRLGPEPVVDAPS
jgi:putative membrane protein